MSEFTFGSDAFAWPTAWFDVPAVSPRREQRSNMHTEQYASDLEFDNVPELDRKFARKHFPICVAHRVIPQIPKHLNHCHRRNYMNPALRPPRMASAQSVTSPSLLHAPCRTPRPPSSSSIIYQKMTKTCHTRPTHTAASTVSEDCRKTRPQPRPPATSSHDTPLPSSKRRKVSEPYSQQQREPAVVGVDASWIPQSHHHFPGGGQPHLFPQHVDYFGRTQSDAVMMGWI